MKYFSFRKQKNDSVMFHGLYKETQNCLVKCDSNAGYDLLEYNPIVEAAVQILEDKYYGGL